MKQKLINKINVTLLVLSFLTLFISFKELLDKEIRHQEKGAKIREYLYDLPFYFLLPFHSYSSDSWSKKTERYISDYPDQDTNLFQKTPVPIPVFKESKFGRIIPGQFMSEFVDSILFLFIILSIVCFTVCLVAANQHLWSCFKNMAWVVVLVFSLVLVDRNKMMVYEKPDNVFPRCQHYVKPVDSWILASVNKKVETPEKEQIMSYRIKSSMEAFLESLERSREENLR